jgi:hypothetical protein
LEILQIDRRTTEETQLANPGTTDNMQAVYLYTDDNSTQWNLQLSESMAAAGGFTSGSGSAPVWRKYKSRKAHVRGVWATTQSATGKWAKVFIPCASVSQMMTLFGAGSVDYDGASWNVVGRHGECVSRLVVGG